MDTRRILAFAACLLLGIVPVSEAAGKRPPPPSPRRVGDAVAPATAPTPTAAVVHPAPPAAAAPPPAALAPPPVAAVPPPVPMPHAWPAVSSAHAAMPVLGGPPATADRGAPLAPGGHATADLGGGLAGIAPAGIAFRTYLYKFAHGSDASDRSAMYYSIIQYIADVDHALHN